MVPLSGTGSKRDATSIPLGYCLDQRGDIVRGEDAVGEGDKECVGCVGVFVLPRLCSGYICCLGWPNGNRLAFGHWHPKTSIGVMALQANFTFTIATRASERR